MPYRHLPNTDNQRLQALDGAAAKSAAVDPANLAFSAESKTTLDTLRPQFQTEVAERGQALAAQSDASTAVRDQAGRLRMFVSHFFQNLNMGIERGVFADSDRAHYQLDVSQTTLPEMTREADLLTWAGRAISGEASRTAAGGVAMPFPSAAEVQAELTQYTTLASDQSTKKDTYDSEQEDVEALRDDVDGLIKDIWDEVEFTFRREKPSSLRRKAKEYGVVYMTRPGEPPDEDEGNGETG